MLNSKAKAKEITNVEIYTDSKAAIKKLKARRINISTVNQHRDPNFDIKNQIIHEIAELTEKSKIVSINYVKSHGINTKKKDLSPIEKIHCQADGLAKQARLLPRQTNYNSFSTNKVTFSMNNHILNTNYTIAWQQATEPTNTIHINKHTTSVV
jgi:hypothetical protein